MRSAAARAELPAWCPKHNVAFVKFVFDRSHFSFGCPVCVAARREDVRKVRATPRRGLKRIPEDTGKRKPG